MLRFCCVLFCVGVGFDLVRCLGFMLLFVLACVVVVLICLDMCLLFVCCVVDWVGLVWLGVRVCGCV